MLTGGHTSLLSPDACQTAIDAVLYENYDREETPAFLSSRNPLFFKQGGIDSMSFIFDEDSNVGEFEEHEEQAEIKTSNTFIGNQKTVRVKKRMKSIPVSWEAFKTDQVGKRERIGSQIGDRARLTQDKRAIIDVYGDAFAGSINTCADGVALSSNSHVSLTGGTVDNYETGAMSPDNLWTLVTSLLNQPAQDGELGSHVFNGILVPTTLYKHAKEVLNSTLIADGGENNLNIFDTDFGQVAIKQSQFLGSAYNSATNANTSFYIVSQNHMIFRKVLSEVETDLIEPRYSRTDSYEYRARFCDRAFPGSWTGFAASDGSVAV